MCVFPKRVPHSHHRGLPLCSHTLASSLAGNFSPEAAAPPPPSGRKKTDAGVGGMTDCMGAIRVLFGVVADSSRATRDRLVASVHAVEASSAAGWALDWAVLAYDNDVGAWQATSAAITAARLERVRLTAVLGRGDHHARAVHVHRDRLLNYSVSHRGAYDVVWFLDGDISLHRLDLHALLRRWRCARRCGDLPSGPALITQPTIEPATQLWGLNHVYWNQSELVTVHTRWVEQQAPIFDGVFLTWLHRQPLVREILRLQDVHGTSWGMDAVWCSAARTYAASEPAARGRMPCAVQTLPVLHEDAGGMPHKEVARGGMRLLRDAGLIAQVCTNESCAVHPWFYLPDARFKMHSRYNSALRAGWVTSGCLAGEAHANSAVRARRWRSRTRGGILEWYRVAGDLAAT